MRNSHSFATLTTIFATIVFSIYCTIISYLDVVDQEPQIIKGYVTGLLLALPGMIACAPHVLHITQTLKQKLLWTASGMIMLIVTTVTTVAINNNTGLWLFSAGMALVITGYGITQALEKASSKTHQKAMIVTRIVGTILIAFPAIGALMISLPTEPIQVTPTILIICAVLFGFNLRIKNFPVGYTIAFALGIFATLSLIFIDSFLVAGVWLVATTCLTIGMITLFSESDSPRKMKQK